MDEPTERRATPWKVGCIVLAVGIALIGFIFPLCSIQLRSATNHPIARSMLKELQQQHPTLGFEGGYGYERHQIEIRIYGRAGPEQRAAIKDYLVRTKAERRVTATVRLEYYDRGEEPTAIDEF